MRVATPIEWYMESFLLEKIPKVFLEYPHTREGTSMVWEIPTSCIEGDAWFWATMSEGSKLVNSQGNKPNNT